MPVVYGLMAMGMFLYPESLLVTVPLGVICLLVKGGE